MGESILAHLSWLCMGELFDGTYREAMHGRVGDGTYMRWLCMGEMVMAHI